MPRTCFVPSSERLEPKSDVYWRGGRVVEGGGFEIHCRATYRGFESRLLRHVALPAVRIVLER